MSTNWYQLDKESYVEEIKDLYDRVGEDYTVLNFLNLIVIMLGEAFDEGHKEGYDEGYEEGYDEGHDCGYNDGYEVGYDEGYTEGE